MTPEAQRIAIAEACGYPKRFYKSKDIRVGGKMSGTAIWNLPDYLNDLNAMHEAEKVLTFEQWAAYVDSLIDNSPMNTGVAHRGYEVCHATAAQRAEAFLRTLGLWQD